MLEKNYLGDINIQLRKQDFKSRHTVFDCKDVEIENLINVGRCATWHKITMIKNAALISKTLDSILEDLNQHGIQHNGNQHHIFLKKVVLHFFSIGGSVYENQPHSAHLWRTFTSPDFVGISPDRIRQSKSISTFNRLLCS